MIDDFTNCLGISYSNADSKIKRELLNCFDLYCEEEVNIFNNVYNVPFEFKKYNGLEFLSAESCLGDDEIGELFLLLNQLFPGTYMYIADEWCEVGEDDWDTEELDGLVIMEKEIILLDPNEMIKYQFTLRFSEMLDQGGGSNGADVDFDHSKKIKKKKLKLQKPSTGFVEKILYISTEKGYQELSNLIVK